MGLYRKKPVIIEAVQLTEDNIDAMRLWTGGFVNRSGQLCIDTLEGVMRANIGDYIIKGVQGEHYPCKPDIFEQTYEVFDG